MRYVVGVDIGPTSALAAVGSENGEIQGSGRAGPANPSHLDRPLDALFLDWLRED